MKITANKIKRKLQSDYGYSLNENDESFWFIDGIIKDTLKIVDEIMKEQKGISIKK